MPRHVYGLFNCAVILNIHSKVIFREATFQSNTSKHTDWLAFLLTIMGEIIVIYGLKSVFWPMKSFLVYIYSMTFEVIQWQLPLALIKIAPCGRAHSVCVFFSLPPTPCLFFFFLIDRDHFQLGTLSHTLNIRATGYLELSEWPEVAPDPSVRNVEVAESVRLQHSE